jgi:glycine dehydrogenase subunit 2
MQSIDAIAEAMIEIAQETIANPQMVHDAPLTTPVRRTDDVRAVKQMEIKYII